MTLLSDKLYATVILVVNSCSVRACVRACACVYVRACVRVCVRVCVDACVLMSQTSFIVLLLCVTSPTLCVFNCMCMRCPMSPARVIG